MRQCDKKLLLRENRAASTPPMRLLFGLIGFAAVALVGDDLLARAGGGGSWSGGGGGDGGGRPYCASLRSLWPV